MIQIQTAPTADPARVGHFLRRDAGFGESTNLLVSSLVDLSDLPSNVGDTQKEDTRKRRERDAKVTRTLNSKAGREKMYVNFLRVFIVPSAVAFALGFKMISLRQQWFYSRNLSLFLVASLVIIYCLKMMIT